MRQEKVKANVRKLRAANVATSAIIILLGVSLLFLAFADVLAKQQAILLYAVLLLVTRIASRVIMSHAWKKYVHNVLDEELDAPAYVEILTRVGKYDPYAVHQLQAICAEGRFADAVSLCANQLNNPYAKKNAPVYLIVMENAYFQLGDDARLRTTYEVMEQYLAKQKNPAKLRNRIPVHGFYASYLARDLDACEAYCATVSTPNRIAVVSRSVMQARIALLRGDTDTAAALYRQVLAEAPHTPQAVVAKAHLEAIERGEGYDSAFPEAIPDPLFPVVATEKRHRIMQTVWRAVMIMLGVCLLAFFVLQGIVDHQRAAYHEELRETLEVTYDGVAVIDDFYITDGETNLETVAVFTTDEGFVMAALYCLSDSPDEILNEPLAVFTQEDFEGEAFPSRAFHGYVSEYVGVCTFYESEKDVPGSRIFACPVTVCGRELWFAVTVSGMAPSAS